MKVMIMNRLWNFVACLLLGAGGMAAMPGSGASETPGAVRSGAPTELPAESIYRLAVPLTDAKGARFSLGDMAGRPTLVTMFYGDCSTACPVVLKNLQDTVAAIGAQRATLRVLLISLSPARDTPESLARLADAHQLDPKIFRLSVSDDDAHTRAIAVALGIKYRILENGEINHSTRLVLVDALGRPVASSSRFGVQPDPELLRQIRALLKAS